MTFLLEACEVYFILAEHLFHFSLQENLTQKGTPKTPYKHELLPYISYCS